MFLDKTNELVDALDPLNTRIDGSHINTILDIVIHRYAEMAALGFEAVCKRCDSLILPFLKRSWRKEKLQRWVPL